MTSGISLLKFYYTNKNLTTHTLNVFEIAGNSKQFVSC